MDQQRTAVIADMLYRVGLGAFAAFLVLLGAYVVWLVRQGKR